MNDIECPWCDEPFMEEASCPEGVRKCSRCKKIFEFRRFEEVTYKTYKIERIA